MAPGEAPRVMMPEHISAGCSCSPTSRNPSYCRRHNKVPSCRLPYEARPSPSPAVPLPFILCVHPRRGHEQGHRQKGLARMEFHRNLLSPVRHTGSSRKCDDKVANRHVASRLSIKAILGQAAPMSAFPGESLSQAICDPTYEPPMSPRSGISPRQSGCSHRMKNKSDRPLRWQPHAID